MCFESSRGQHCRVDTLAKWSGVREGTVFPSYRELFDSGVHRHTVKGIVGGGEQGAESIVLSGGYEDDRDEGALIIYTGEGGQDSSKRQVADQTFTGGNRALALNRDVGLPVRVIRGFKLKDSAFRPTHGYRYDGLYQ